MNTRSPVPDSASPRVRAGTRFAILCAICVVFTGGYAWLSVVRARHAVRDVRLLPVAHGLETAAPSPTPPPESLKPDTESEHRVTPPVTEAPPPAAPVFLVRHVSPDRSYGLLAVDPGDPSRGTRRATPLTCDRLYFAAGHGVCLLAGRPFLTSYSAILFDASFRPKQTIALDGIPSRVRVSPDGRRAAITVFVGGHSYGDDGFATETSIIDTNTGDQVVANLEEFQVFRDGQLFKKIDFNFWGVTFAADGNGFYASLGTAGATYLLKGDLRGRTARVIREGVECPSLSPDNSRVAFKKPVLRGAKRTWRLSVLNLETLEETPLAETRSVDDQAEWLDDSRILYGLPDESRGADVTDVWMVPADGSGQPEVFLKEASSPTVVRTRLRGSRPDPTISQ
jgi:hypothetical protein